MIVPDSSVWIDYLNGNETQQTALLTRLLGSELYAVVTGDIILTEVLQGFRDDTEFQYARELLVGLRFEEMLGQKIALQSAQNNRLLRQRGITLRKTTNLIIGTFCIINGLTLLHSDQDFAPMIEHLGLKVLSSA